MTRNVRSEWHVDGTRTPSTWKRAGQPPEIWGRHTAEAVPLRAIRVSGVASRSLETRGFWCLRGSSGTEWHEGPSASIRVHGRAS